MKAESDHFVLTDALAFVALPRLRPVKGNAKAGSQYDNVRQQRRGFRANWRVSTMQLMLAVPIAARSQTVTPIAEMKNWSPFTGDVVPQGP
jgi:outer membrane usher protein FimD/PapC